MILGVVPREDDQAFAVEIQVDEREAGAEPVMVFGLAALADLVEVEDTFNFSERTVHLDAHTRLVAALLLLLVNPPDPYIWFACRSCPEPRASLHGSSRSGPGNQRRPTPCAPRRTADHATCGSPSRWPPSPPPNGPRLPSAQVLRPQPE